MIVLQQAPLLLLVLFLLSVLAAAAVDVRKRRVPNMCVAGAALSGVAAFIVTGNASLLWQPLLAALVILLAGTFMFARGWIGGGDVKLLAGAALWFTGQGVLTFLASVFLAGGVLALVAVGWRVATHKRVSRESGYVLPYAVAIAAGAVALVAFERI